jgi:hypothetical protein
MANADITKILTDAEIAALRAGFSEAFMREGARNALINRFPRCEELINADLDLFYADDYGDRPGELGANVREKVVLTALAVSGNWDMAAIHIYWGLCLPKQPLSPAQLGEVILLAGSYSGVQVISMGLARIAQVFGVLQQAVGAGATRSDQIVALLTGAPLAEVVGMPPPKSGKPGKPAKPKDSGKAKKPRAAGGAAQA